jgi:hypothetical protein
VSEDEVRYWDKDRYWDGIMAGRDDCGAEIDEYRTEITELNVSIATLRAELAKAIAERDEARREACNSEVRADMLSHYNGHEPDEDEILTKARELAVEKGWDCFKEVKS